MEFDENAVIPSAYECQLKLKLEKHLLNCATYLCTKNLTELNCTCETHPDAKSKITTSPYEWWFAYSLIEKLFNRRSRSESTKETESLETVQMTAVLLDVLNCLLFRNLVPIYKL